MWLSGQTRRKVCHVVVCRCSNRELYGAFESLLVRGRSFFFLSPSFSVSRNLIKVVSFRKNNSSLRRLDLLQIFFLDVARIETEVTLQIIQETKRQKRGAWMNFLLSWSKELFFFNPRWGVLIVALENILNETRRTWCGKGKFWASHFKT